jgi:N12 class adenine-specific DNA methylase
MRKFKPQHNPNQLDLFSYNFSNDKNEPDATDNDTNNQREGKDLHGAHGRTDSAQAGTSGTHRDNDTGSPSQTPTGDIPTDAERKPFGGNYKGQSVELSFDGSAENVQGSRTQASGRNRNGQPHENVQPFLNNFHRTEDRNRNISFSKSQSLNDNLAALETLFTLEKEQRTATKEEQENLGNYVGWGGLKEILLDPAKPEEWKTESDIKLRPTWEKVHAIFQQLDPDGSQGLLPSARRTVLNAHYTSYSVINSIYAGLEEKGFKGGNVLEPAAGIGNFLAAMPVDSANKSEVTAVEMDILTGKILSKLFPSANTHINAFEKLKLPENNYDLVISNVPFSEVQVYDKQLKDKPEYEKAANNLHNYFFAKSILLAKEDATIALITSRFTMDSEDKSIRNLIANECKFLGAIRLDDKAFQANAGTNVVADIIFLKKLALGESNTQEHDFMNTKPLFIKNKELSGTAKINEYFIKNPNHMLGKPSFSTMYGFDPNNLQFSLENIKDLDRSEEISKILSEILPENLFKESYHDKKERATENYIRLGDYDTIGNIVSLGEGRFGRISGDVYINELLDERVKLLGINPNDIRSLTLTNNERNTLRENKIDIEDFNLKMVDEIKYSKADQAKLPFVIKLRELTKEIIFKESSGFNDYALDRPRSELLTTYRTFQRKFGNLLSKDNQNLLNKDSDGAVISALENLNWETNKIEPSKILFKRTIFPKPELVHTENVEEAVANSVSKFGKLNMNYISELLDKPMAQLVAEENKKERPAFFKDTEGRYVYRDAYLSGNVKKKLALATREAETNTDFYTNVRELEKVQPKKINAIDIYSPLHARWIPKEMIQDFVSHLFDTKATIAYNPAFDEMKARINASGFGNANVTKLGTKRRSAEWIINQAVNGTDPKVTYITEIDGKEKTVTDYDDTLTARRKVEYIRKEWDDFKYENIGRRTQLEDIYNARFNNFVERKYDGSAMLLPGLVGFNLMNYQRDAVLRNVLQFGGINDHIVGAGKTLVQIATAMELKRIGHIHKPMLIGLKSQIPQLYGEFKKAYPLANVLFPTEKDFSKENRPKLLNKIATNDFDAIILSHDQFTMIKQPERIQVQIIEKQMDELRDLILETGDGKDDKTQKRKLENQLYKYEQKLEKILDTHKDDKALSFDKIGVDFLIVDESQEFKNLEFLTKKTNIRGLGNPTGSKKAFNLMIASRYLQEMHKGDKGVLFSSGTPISNTMAEMFLLFKYLRPNKLDNMGLNTFDKWAGCFANDYSDLEYYLGKFKEVHRFREFTNLPELLTMYREVADVKNSTNITIDKPQNIHELVKIPPSQKQLHYIEMLQEYIETKGNKHDAELGLTAGYDEDRKMNPSYAILAQNFAKKLSIDTRMIDGETEPGTKISTAADNIFKIYQDTNHFKGTQLVFCDLGTPKSKNEVENVYNFLQSNDTPKEQLQEIFGNQYEDGKFNSGPVVMQKIKEVLEIKDKEVAALYNEANTAHKFCVYDELKHQLVQKGIPEQEIHYIHDYNTTKAKLGFYEKVNAGDIRIVLGSTKKLGTGVNIQQRAAAMHHLDITWKPSDLEQRNGRGARQFNFAAKQYLDNKITSYYYATERTLDASLYNTVALKAHFIEQSKLQAKASIRSVKDIDEDLDMSLFAAELSGDLIFKEKATLIKQIDHLEREKKSFNAEMHSIQDSIDRSSKLIPALETRAGVIEGVLPGIQKIKSEAKEGEEPKLLMKDRNNKEYDKISEWGKAMLQEIEYQKLRNNPTSFLVGHIENFKIFGKVTFANVQRTIQTEDGKVLKTGDAFPETDMAMGLQLKNIVLGLDAEFDRIKANIDRTKENLLQYKEAANKTFPNDKELFDKKTRLQEINQIIVDRDKEKNQQDNKEGNEYKNNERDDNLSLVEEPKAQYKVRI